MTWIKLFLRPRLVLDCCSALCEVIFTIFFPLCLPHIRLDYSYIPCYSPSVWSKRSVVFWNISKKSFKDSSLEYKHLSSLCFCISEPWCDLVEPFAEGYMRELRTIWQSPQQFIYQYLYGIDYSVVFRTLDVYRWDGNNIADPLPEKIITFSPSTPPRRDYFRPSARLQQESIDDLRLVKRDGSHALGNLHACAACYV